MTLRHQQASSQFSHPFSENNKSSYFYLTWCCGSQTRCPTGAIIWSRLCPPGKMVPTTDSTDGHVLSSPWLLLSATNPTPADGLLFPGLPRSSNRNLGPSVLYPHPVAPLKLSSLIFRVVLHPAHVDLSLPSGSPNQKDPTCFTHTGNVTTTTNINNNN